MYRADRSERHVLSWLFSIFNFVSPRVVPPRISALELSSNIFTVSNLAPLCYDVLLSEFSSLPRSELLFLKCGLILALGFVLLSSSLEFSKMLCSYAAANSGTILQLYGSFDFSFL